MSANGRGILFMLLFVAVLPFLDAVTKVLVADHAAPQILAIRFAMLTGVFIAPAFVLAGPVLRAPAERPLLLLRGALLGGASMFYVASLEFLTLADTTAVAMLFPLIVTAVSPLVLGERVGLVRYSAVGLGIARSCSARHSAHCPTLT